MRSQARGGGRLEIWASGARRWTSNIAEFSDRVEQYDRFMGCVEQRLARVSKPRA